MHQHVTVVPADSLIIVDGEALRFVYAAPPALRAIQWRDGQGHMEFADDLNHPISGPDLYAQEVAPYVALWTAEKTRLEAAAAEATAQREAAYNSPEAVQARFTAAIQERLDQWAQTRNYDGIMSACTYAGSTVDTFRHEGQCAVALRDATWAAGYAIMDSVLSGQRPMPSVEEVVAELPPLLWPDATGGA